MISRLLFLLLVLAPVFATDQKTESSAEAADANCSQANTQMEINQCLGDAYQKADKKLNQTYSGILKKQDAAGQARLRTVQRAWVKYRDANCDAAAARYAGGSIQPSIHSECLKRITAARIDELQHVYALNP